LTRSTSKQIKVLLTVPHLFSAAAPYRDMMAIARYLPREEFDLTICSAGQKGYKESKAVLDQLGRRNMVARFRPAGASPTAIISSLRAQSRIDKEGPFDIQHSIMGTSSPFEAFLSKLMSRSHIHSQIDMTDGGQPALFRLKLRLSKKIISVSESVRNFVISKGIPPEKVKTIYNGLDIDEIDQALAQQKRQPSGRILAVGLIVRRKRQEDAIKAMAFIAKELPNVRLGVVGRVVEPDYYDELVNLVNDLGLSSRVEFLGVRTDVIQLMQQSNALIHCADSEGLPWVVLEAMAAGLPVIGSSIGPIHEMVDADKTGVIVPLGDVAGYANAVRRIMTQPAFSEQLAINARQIAVSKFSARTMVAQIASLYRELAA
jgi:glycosyltransferase involved in cell wall biosynthesis